MGIVQEFKEFAMKGNAVDMAVGIILGGAFQKVVSSVVNDILMPPLGLLLGGVDFKNLQWVIKSEFGKEAVAIRYGLFINNVIDFLIVAFAMFMVIKVMNQVIKSREPAKA